MKISYIDPSLGAGRGHNFSMYCEFLEEFQNAPNIQVQFLANNPAGLGAVGSPAAAVRQAFRVEGYQRFGLSTDQEAASLSGALKATAEDIIGLNLEDSDVILMPTVFPLHLHALSQVVRLKKYCKLVLGLMLPYQLWCKDKYAEELLSGWLEQDLAKLMAAHEVIAYSETGRYSLPRKGLSLPVLLPPVSRATHNTLRSLARQVTKNARPVIGFFGNPFPSKGFVHLVKAVEALLAGGKVPSCRLRIHLPPGHERLCETLSSCVGWIEATSCDSSNSAYLEAISKVDLVWAIYDPSEYSSKMSGIVPEALALRKPILLAEGCEAINEFIQRYAPGSQMLVEYSLNGVLAALDVPSAAVEDRKRGAHAHADLMLELKSMDRYLSVCGLSEGVRGGGGENSPHLDSSRGLQRRVPLAA